MKKSYILFILILATSIGIVFYSLGSSSTYATFKEVEDFPNKEFHVVGTLNLDKEMRYNPEVNANLFTFYLIDNDGQERKINYSGTKPQDFEKSEQVVVIGKAGNTGTFNANKILMKCPSKYNDTNMPEDY
jgi:cytochrome c-type biogenesis protein CcmE